MKLLVPVLLASALAFCGCASKAKLEKEKRTAFTAGQQQAVARTSELPRVNIRVLGPVRHPEITWTDGLTLAQAIAAAQTTSAGDPQAIYLIRRGERAFVDPQWLLRGGDLPLEPGDTVEIQPY